jgi:hypothetical protein
MPDHVHILGLYRISDFKVCKEKLFVGRVNIVHMNSLINPAVASTQNKATNDMIIMVWKEKE